MAQIVSLNININVLLKVFSIMNFLVYRQKRKILNIRKRTMINNTWIFSKNAISINLDQVSVNSKY